MKGELGRGGTETHIDNIDRGDLTLLIMPNMLEEHEERYELAVKILNKTDNKSGKLTVIDMASARGLGTEILKAKLPNANVIGLEKGFEYIQKAQEKNPQNDLYAQADVLQTPIASGCADAVTMFEILEHVPKDDQIKLLREAFRITKKGGTVIVSTPLPYSFNQKGERTGASSNPFHLYEPSSKELDGWAQEAGFEVIDRYGQSYATKKGVAIAQKLEEMFSKVGIPFRTLYGINLNFIRNPKPTKIEKDNNLENRPPLTQIFVLKKPLE